MDRRRAQERSAEAPVPVEVTHPGTVALLRQLRARQAAEELAAGETYTSTGFVVVDALGNPMRPELYSDRFRRLCQQAGVQVIHLHSVRHSLAFWLHSLDVTPATGGDASALQDKGRVSLIGSESGPLQSAADTWPA